MKTYEEIEAILTPWTGAHMEAAQREGWDLITATDDSPVQVQRIDDPEYLPSGISTHLPNDDAAMVIVCTGTGEHHSVARKILQEHFPEEWALVETAAATFEGESTTLVLLRQAVAAKIAFWDASRELETHLGLDPTTDVDTAIQEEISALASGYPENVPGMAAVTEEHVNQLRLAVARAS